MESSGGSSKSSNLLQRGHIAGRDAGPAHPGGPYVRLTCLRISRSLGRARCRSLECKLNSLGIKEAAGVRTPSLSRGAHSAQHHQDHISIALPAPILASPSFSPSPSPSQSSSPSSRARLQLEVHLDFALGRRARRTRIASSAHIFFFHLALFLFLSFSLRASHFSLLASARLLHARTVARSACLHLISLLLFTLRFSASLLLCF